MPLHLAALLVILSACATTQTSCLVSAIAATKTASTTLPVLKLVSLGVELSVRLVCGERHYLHHLTYHANTTIALATAGSSSSESVTATGSASSASGSGTSIIVGLNHSPNPNTSLTV